MWFINVLYYCEIDTFIIAIRTFLSLQINPFLSHQLLLKYINHYFIRLVKTLSFW